MSGHADTPAGPDLAAGVALTDIPDGAMLLGHVGDEPVLLARRGDEWFAIGAVCTHAGGPLAEGLRVDDTVRCPWHHACYDLRSGDVLRAPALDGVPRWRVESREGRVVVREKLPAAGEPPAETGAGLPAAIVIVGAGAAGASAAETLRREGYTGTITVLGADPDAPYDRTSLSKGFLAGTAAGDAVALRPAEFYREHRIDLLVGAPVATIDPAKRTVQLADGARIAYDALLLATGARPVRLEVPGADLPHVHVLRTFADGRALAKAAVVARRAVVIGASFIGLEVAAALRARYVEVDVVAPGSVPMEKVLGAEVGAGFRRLHERHGVRFHMGAKPASIDAETVTLEDGRRLTADLVVVGIGVRPALELAEQAGLHVDRGVVVNEFLETSEPGIWAAGDIARFPDARSGEGIRVEHWVVAQRQGATAARNMLGKRERFDAVPFFWTEQYDFSLVYVGHAERWDAATLEGDFDASDCAVRYTGGGRTLAVATVYRDLDSLRAELEMERSGGATGG